MDPIPMRSRMYSGLAVLEARWWKEKNLSVRPLFDTFSKINYSNADAYSYDMFCDENSFRINMQRLGADTATRYLYISCRGDEKQLMPNENNSISRSKLKFITSNANIRHTIRGVYFNSSLSISRIAPYMLSETNALDWVIGYGGEAAWAEAAVVDLFFFNTLLMAERARAGGPASPAVPLIEEVATAVRANLRGLAGRLRLQIFRRRKDGGIDRLL